MVHDGDKKIIQKSAQVYYVTLCEDTPHRRQHFSMALPFILVSRMNRLLLLLFLVKKYTSIISVALLLYLNISGAVLKIIPVTNDPFLNIFVTLRCRNYQDLK